MGNNQTSNNYLISFSGAGCVSYVRFLERERALANQGYSGTPLYKKMHDDMFVDIGCFVAGKLIHTDQGLNKSRR